jgi:hypothetical protein
VTTADDYMALRKVQARAREEMWHVLSHHPETQRCWNAEGSCYKELRDLVEWEPEDG